jgi:hypothetical protein
MKRLLTSCIAIALASHAFAATAEMRPLFNGKDLTGWKGEGYVVEDGTLVATPEAKVLATENTFSAYVLEFEFKLTPGANNGLGLNYPGEGEGFETGIELQILDNSAKKYQNIPETHSHGSVYSLAPAKNSALKPVGEWNQQRVSVLGSLVLVELNGEMILRANLDDLQKRNPDHAGVKRRSGHIAFLGHGDRVDFRNILIQEIPPSANIEGVKAAGYQPLFDGKSLANWKHTETTQNWYAANGILKHTGEPGDINDLWTAKEYGDFSLVFDWRWSGRGVMKSQPIVQPDGSNKTDADGQPELVEIEELDSGVYLRGSSIAQVNLWNWPIGSGEVYGYRVDPARSPDVRAAVTPKVKADRPIGEWNRTMINLKGDRLTVSLNGRVVIDNAQLPDIPAKGPIGFQHHGQAIDFANVWIKEL